MSLWIYYKSFLNDSVRQVQLFTLCRQTGIILSSIVLARFLPVDAVGTVEMLILCGYLMTFFWSDALLRGYLAKSNLLTEKYFITSFLWLFFLAGLIFMFLLLVGQSIFIPLFTSRPRLEGLELFALYQVFIIPLWIAPFIGLLKGQNLLLISLYVLVGPAFACWTGLTGIPDILGVLIGLFCYALVGFTWLMTQTKFIPNLKLLNILKIIWPATWPLVLYAISTGIARSFDAWLVARNFDNETFAIFRYGAREFPLVTALSVGLSTMMIPRLQDFKTLHELKSRSTRLMHICYPIVALFIFFSPVVFQYLFGLQYSGSALIFNIYLLLSLTQIIMPQSILTARGDTKILWYVSLGELAINVIASLVLMRYLGLIGIVWGTLIAYFFEKIVLMGILRDRYKIGFSEIINPLIWVMYGLLLIFTFMFSRWVFGI